ncbi:MAG: gamma carbonic anhydrase family protein [Deltaproteobacteria bacterium]|nr:gamma carbonic anhydrase family protein [Deltaproteobacteria bacterium]
MAIIKKFGNFEPEVDGSAFVAGDAVVIGDVKIGPNAGIWYGAILRGDMGRIEIGARSNIQDGTVVHCTSNYSVTVVGEDVTVGHRAVLHGCTLKNKCLIGMGAIVMDNAVVEENVIVAAGSVVLENNVLEKGHLYAGTPVRKIKPLTEAQIRNLSEHALHYVELLEKYR